MTSPNEANIDELVLAAANGRTEMVSALLADLTPEQRVQCLGQQDAFGRLALVWAAENGRTEMVSALLAGLTPEQRVQCLGQQDGNGHLALVQAAANGRTKMVKALITLAAKEAWDSQALADLFLQKEWDGQGKSVFDALSQEGRGYILNALKTQMPAACGIIMDRLPAEMDVTVPAEPTTIGNLRHSFAGASSPSSTPSGEVKAQGNWNVTVAVRPDSDTGTRYTLNN